MLDLCWFYWQTTNPTKFAYISWMKEQLMANQSSGVLEKGFVTLFGTTLFENTTTNSNYGIFSIYKTEFNGDKMTTIGIFNNFVPISETTN